MLILLWILDLIRYFGIIIKELFDFIFSRFWSFYFIFVNLNSFVSFTNFRCCYLICPSKVQNRRWLHQDRRNVSYVIVSSRVFQILRLDTKVFLVGLCAHCLTTPSPVPGEKKAVKVVPTMPHLPLSSMTEPAQTSTPSGFSKKFSSFASNNRKTLGV